MALAVTVVTVISGGTIATNGTAGTSGQGVGGAIFIANGATVTSLGGLPSFSGNTASSNNDVYGTITTASAAVPWDFSTQQLAAIGVPLFIGLRMVKC